MKPKKKERPTNLELLGGVPADTLRRVREIAGKADLPVARVFRDILAIGVSVVADPVESPYQSLIAFRVGLASKQAELENGEQDTTAPKVRRDPGSGTGGAGEPPVAGETLESDIPDFEAGADQDRSGDVDERSGQLTQSEADNAEFAAS
jgi:hypothetical protein